MCVQKRLRTIRKRRSQENFGLEYGFKKTSYAKLETSAKFINPQFLKKLHQNENINLNWLITGQGPQYNNDNLQINEDSPHYSHYKIPLIGNISSPESNIHFYNGSKNIENIEIIENFTKVHLENISKSIVLFEMLGSHLYPKFHDHDIIMFDKSIDSEKISKKNYGIFSIQKDIWIFRRYNIYNNTSLLEPLNPDYHTIAISLSDLNIFGVAIHLFRKLH